MDQAVPARYEPIDSGLLALFLIELRSAFEAKGFFCRNRDVALIDPVLGEPDRRLRQFVCGCNLPRRVLIDGYRADRRRQMADELAWRLVLAEEQTCIWEICQAAADRRACQTFEHVEAEVEALCAQRGDGLVVSVAAGLDLRRCPGWREDKGRTRRFSIHGVPVEHLFPWDAGSPEVFFPAGPGHDYDSLWRSEPAAALYLPVGSVAVRYHKANNGDMGKVSIDLSDSRPPRGRRRGVRLPTPDPEDDGPTAEISASIRNVVHAESPVVFLRSSSGVTRPGVRSTLPEPRPPRTERDRRPFPNPGGDGQRP
jgi:hypothetical protein